jgi:hypothetical protein
MTQALMIISGRGRSRAARIRFFSVIMASSPEIESANTNESVPTGATDIPPFEELDPLGAPPDPEDGPVEALAGAVGDEPPLGAAALAPTRGDADVEGEVVTVVVPPGCVTVTVEAAAPLGVLVVAADAGAGDPELAGEVAEVGDGVPDPEVVADDVEGALMLRAASTLDALR